MLRGAISLLSLLAAVVVSPAARGAVSEFVVYEVVRVRAGGPRTIHVVEKLARGTAPFAVAASVTVRPGDDGWEVRRMGVTMAYTTQGYRAYGWPVAPPPCPADCARESNGFEFSGLDEITPKPGERHLFAGPRGRYGITLDTTYWQVREVGVGFRVVHAPSGDTTGFGTLGANVEHFRSVTAPGGPYGSAVFASLPCDPGAGFATLSHGGVTKSQMGCSPFPGWGFDETTTGGAWRLAGDVVGAYGSTFRMLVFDFPRPR